MVKFEDVAVTEDPILRILGFIALTFSLMALPAIIYGDVTAQVVATLFFLATAIPSSLLAFQKFRKRWSPEYRCLFVEKRFIWGHWRSKKIPISDFVEVQVSPTSGVDQPGIKGSKSGVRVRVRHKDDWVGWSGDRSWVLWSHHSLEEKWEEAVALAEDVADKLNLPLRNSLKENGFRRA